MLRPPPGLSPDRTRKATEGQVVSNAPTVLPSPPDHKKNLLFVHIMVDRDLRDKSGLEEKDRRVAPLSASSEDRSILHRGVKAGG